MKGKGKDSRLVEWLKTFIVILITGYVFVTVYNLSKPSYEWYDCFFNPLACAAQSGTDALIAQLSVFVNPVIIFVFVGIWAVAKYWSR